MRDPDQFDAFYLDSRERLLLQTYALTGDLAASRAAVRDSYVVAWHHWRKISRLQDPESWARPHAWSHAQRRHTARLLHRDKGLDPEVRATLDALAKLPVDQRKTLLLTHLAAVSMPDLAREVGVPQEDAERALQTATAQFALTRGVQSTSIRGLFEPLAALVSDVRWPRATIVRRAGSTRRRTHTLVGAAVAVAALVVSGSLVTDAAGVRPTLARESLSSSPTPEPAPATPTAEPEPELSAEHLLTATQVSSGVAGNAWIVAGTDSNTEGDGLRLRCQQERYADPRGAEALVRRFTSTPAEPADPQVSAVQSTEASRTEEAARRTFRTTLGWYAGCTDPRVQLQSTRRVSGVGDQALLLVLRSWKRPVSTIVVGVARTGQLTTTTMSTTTSTARPDFDGAARVLADAVDGLCTLPDAGACATTPGTTGTPALKVVDAVPTGAVPSMLGEFDLPPVTRIAQPWVGTEATRAVTNVASTQCDDAQFSGAGFSHNLTRSFLIPGAQLPAEFGLTETVASLPRARARAFVQGVRDKLAGCSDDQLGTDVEQIQQVATKTQDLTVWNVTTEISDQRSVRYLMAILRDGSSVAQLGFVPSGDVRMEGGAFVALAYRALERLHQQPAPS